MHENMINIVEAISIMLKSGESPKSNSLDIPSICDGYKPNPREVKFAYPTRTLVRFP